MAQHAEHHGDRIEADERREIDRTARQQEPQHGRRGADVHGGNEQLLDGERRRRQPQADSEQPSFPSIAAQHEQHRGRNEDQGRNRLQDASREMRHAGHRSRAPKQCHRPDHRDAEAERRCVEGNRARDHAGFHAGSAIQPQPHGPAREHTESDGVRKRVGDERRRGDDPVRHHRTHETQRGKIVSRERHIAHRSREHREAEQQRGRRTHGLDHIRVDELREQAAHRLEQQYTNHEYESGHDPGLPTAQLRQESGARLSCHRMKPGSRPRRVAEWS